MYEIDIENRLIILDLQTISKLLNECPDAVLLYIFYHRQAKLQKTNNVYATNFFCRKGLGWGEDKFKKSKQILKKYNLIEDNITKGSDGKIKGWYVKINYMKNKIIVPHTNESTGVDLPPSGFPYTNAGSTYNINAGSTKEKNTKKESFDHVAESTVDHTVQKTVPSKESITIKNILDDKVMEELRGLDILQDFVNYWGETNSRGVERRKLEKTWDTNKRIARWVKNKETNFGRIKQLDMEDINVFNEYISSDRLYNGKEGIEVIKDWFRKKYGISIKSNGRQMRQDQYAETKEKWRRVFILGQQ